MGTPGSYKLREIELENGDSTQKAKEKKFPCIGDPLEGLDEKSKKLFQDCQDLTSFDEASLETLEEDTLKATDKNGMNVFHVLLYEKGSPDWFTKDLDSESRGKVVSIIKSICKKFPKHVISELMKQQDTSERTPLHYAAIIDIDKEEAESNITLALLLNGADKTLFQKGQSENCWEPVGFICTSTLSKLFDTKHRNDGPVGHPDRVAHCDISTLQPPPIESEKSQKKSKNPLHLDYLRILAVNHRDLFDHQVISALIWEKRKEYLVAIFFASIMKLIGLLMLFIGFGLRFGPQKEKEMSSLLFYAVFAIEFSPLILHCVVVTKALRRRYNKKEDSNFMNIFFHTKRRCLLILTHLAVGLSLVTAFKFPETISLSYQRGFAGFYCICAAYQAFRTWRDLLQPTVFEMFGWFEVVFKNIIELLAVHSWLLLTFVFAFYIQFNNFEEVDQKGWLQNCQFKFTNCTDIIIQLNANTGLIKDDPELLADCMDFFQECTQSEAQAGNAFNNWKVVLKVLSMAAGELGYDDLPFGDNPITILTFTLFIILVLFVIMNLMTSLAVNDIQEIRNRSRDGTWNKLMFTLMWYHAALPEWVQKVIRTEPEEDKDINIISFKLNEVATLSDPRTWFNFITRMPDSVSLKAKGNAQPGGHSSGKFTITNKVEEFDHIVIIIGTKANFTERVLKKGEVLEEKINYWRTQFAIVDSTNGYDISRKSYRTQRFTASEENSQLEVKFWSYQNGGKIGEFRVWNQATGKKLEGKSQNYKNVEHEPSEDIKKAIEQYKK